MASVVLEGDSFRRALLLLLGEALEFLPSLTLLLRIEFAAIPLDFCGRQRLRLLLFNLRQFLTPLPDRSRSLWSSRA